MDVIQRKIPQVIVVTCGSDKWVFLVRLNPTTNRVQLYGKTTTKFLQMKEFARGHFIQFSIGTDKVFVTDFNQLGLSQHYYHNDEVGRSRPKCLVKATLDSATNQAIPDDF